MSNSNSANQFRKVCPLWPHGLAKEFLLLSLLLLHWPHQLVSDTYLSQSLWKIRSQPWRWCNGQSTSFLVVSFNSQTTLKHSIWLGQYSQFDLPVIELGSVSFFCILRTSLRWSPFLSSNTLTKYPPNILFVGRLLRNCESLFQLLNHSLSSSHEPSLSQDPLKNTDTRTMQSLSIIIMVLHTSRRCTPIPLHKQQSVALATFLLHHINFTVYSPKPRWLIPQARDVQI